MHKTLHMSYLHSRHQVSTSVGFMQILAIWTLALLQLSFTIINYRITKASNPLFDGYLYYLGHIFDSLKHFIYLYQSATKWWFISRCVCLQDGGGGGGKSMWNGFKAVEIKLLFLGPICCCQVCHTCNTPVAMLLGNSVGKDEFSPLKNHQGTLCILN